MLDGSAYAQYRPPAGMKEMYMRHPPKGTPHPNPKFTNRHDQVIQQHPNEEIESKMQEEQPKTDEDSNLRRTRTAHWEATLIHL